MPAPPAPSRRPTEAELLELVEGSLSPAREREVRAAAAADPELAGQILRMMQHRSMLRQIDQTIDTRAPSDLAEQAVIRARAEHMQHMHHHQAHAQGPRRDGRPHHSKRALALAATVALLTIGGWVWFMVSRVGPSGSANQPTAYKTPRIDIDRTAEKDMPALEPALPSPEEAAYGNEIDRVLADSRTITESLRPEFIGPPATAANADVRATVASDNTIPDSRAQADSLIDEWVANLGGIEPGADLTPARAAELLDAGKLRIVLRADPNAESKSRVLNAAKDNGGGRISPTDAIAFAPIPADPFAAPKETPRPAPKTLTDASRAVVLVIDKPKARAELADKLAALLDRIAKSAAAEARFDEAIPSEDPLAGLESSDLLWWTRPSEAWDRSTVLRLPVVFIGAGAKPEPPR